MQDISGIALEATAGRPTTLGDVLDGRHIDGFIVLHKGAVVHEVCGNGMAPRDPHILMSSTKSFTGSLAGILTAQDLLDEAAGDRPAAGSGGHGL